MNNRHGLAMIIATAALMVLPTHTSQPGTDSPTPVKSGPTGPGRV